MSTIQVVSNGQMRAQSVSIQVSDRTRCNGKCMFCISRVTPHASEGCATKLCNLNRCKVGLNFARYIGATHTILTSQADPTQENPDYLCELTKTAKEYTPFVDMHTNGLILQKEGNNLLQRLTDAGLTMVTFSIASFDADVDKALMGVAQNAPKLIRLANSMELLVRCSLVVCKSGVHDFNGIMDYIKAAGELGAHMVVIREIWTPQTYNDSNKEVADWNIENKIDLAGMEATFKTVASNRNNEFGVSERDPLPWGTPVFAVGGIFSDKTHGVNVTFARCGEATRGPVIKSLIHKYNGHGYRNWDHNGDILY